LVINLVRGSWFMVHGSWFFVNDYQLLSKEQTTTNKEHY